MGFSRERYGKQRLGYKRFEGESLDSKIGWTPC